MESLNLLVKCPHLKVYQVLFCLSLFYLLSAQYQLKTFLSHLKDYHQLDRVHRLCLYDYHCYCVFSALVVVVLGDKERVV